MTTDWLKFINKLPANLREPILIIIQDILNGNVSKYQVIKIEGYSNVYRIRKGKIRILFGKNKSGFYMMDVDFRGGVYKNMK